MDEAQYLAAIIQAAGNKDTMLYIASDRVESRSNMEKMLVESRMFAEASNEITLPAITTVQDAKTELCSSTCSSDTMNHQLTDKGNIFSDEWVWQGDLWSRKSMPCSVEGSVGLCADTSEPKALALVLKRPKIPPTASEVAYFGLSEPFVVTKNEEGSLVVLLFVVCV